MEYKDLPSFKSSDGKLWFRPADDGDIDFIVNLRNTAFVREHFVYREDFTRESQKKWMDTKVYTGEVVQYIFGTGEERVGCTYLLHFEGGKDWAEYGIFMDEAFAGRGFGTIVCRTMAELSLKLGFKGCVSRAISDNKASIRMMEKSGYIEKMRIVENTIPDGKELEMVILEYHGNASDTVT